MRDTTIRLASEEEGSIHLYYAVALLLLVLISKPSLARLVFYKVETLFRMLVGQLLSLI